MGGLERYLTRDMALLVAANAIPLLGVLLAGWDAFTLLILYWFESAVIGLWVCVAIGMSTEKLAIFTRAGDPNAPSGIGAALFVAAHAGIFMFVHLMFLVGFRSVSSSGMDDVPALLMRLLLEEGLWLPLAGLFLLRGLITVSDHVAGRPLGPVVTGFYMRIIVMQFVILLGGFVTLLLGDSVVQLILLIGLRLAIDVGIEPIAQRLKLFANSEPSAPADPGR